MNIPETGINRSTMESIESQLNNEHELRYYLRQIRRAMKPAEEGVKPFVPSYIVTAVKLPTGAIELAVNTEHILEKIDYILNTYDGNMRHSHDPAVCMQNVMVV